MMKRVFMKILKKIIDFFLKRFEKNEDFYSEKICYIIEELMKIYETSKKYQLIESTIELKKISSENIEKIKNKLNNYENINYILKEKNEIIYLIIKISNYSAIN